VAGVVADEGELGEHHRQVGGGDQLLPGVPEEGEGGAPGGALDADLDGGRRRVVVGARPIRGETERREPPKGVGATVGAVDDGKLVPWACGPARIWE